MSYKTGHDCDMFELIDHSAECLQDSAFKIVPYGWIYRLLLLLLFADL